MGHSFRYCNTNGLPVQFPPLPDAPYDRAIMDAWRAECHRFFAFPPEERGFYDCSYSWTALLCEAMTMNGILVEMSEGKWPERLYVDPNGDSEELTPEAAAFLSREIGPHRVPSFKFSSSDPWLLTPAECRTIAYALHNHPNPDIAEFGRFCGGAAQHDGIRVG